MAPGPQTGIVCRVQQGTKTRQRQTELRTQAAHVVRMIADGLRPGSLRTEPLLRNRVLEFVADTVKVLTASAADDCA